MRVPAAGDLGREIAGDLEAAERREWLATNGIGGFDRTLVSRCLKW